ncbi:MAG TPA: hypothetical protein PLO37_10995 [Candidatus Hydrogenedentes bacterium]|nr:hypothetical protein [Candidatus Hydrogenedentota bacterium]HPG67364.1 hypothetical protein [Candidatus Hydrogenedentota bacterium]
MAYRASLSIPVAAGIIGALVSLASVADEPQSNIDAVTLAAYQDIAEGRPYDGAVKLLGALRDVPEESVECAGEFTDAVYVLAFTVSMRVSLACPNNCSTMPTRFGGAELS